MGCNNVSGAKDRYRHLGAGACFMWRSDVHCRTAGAWHSALNSAVPFAAAALRSTGRAAPRTRNGKTITSAGATRYLAPSPRPASATPRNLAFPHTTCLPPATAQHLLPLPRVAAFLPASWALCCLCSLLSHLCLPSFISMRSVALALRHSFFGHSPGLTSSVQNTTATSPALILHAELMEERRGGASSLILDKTGWRKEGGLLPG